LISKSSKNPRRGGAAAPGVFQRAVPLLRFGTRRGELDHQLPEIARQRQVPEIAAQVFAQIQGRAFAQRVQASASADIVEDFARIVQVVLA